MLDTIYKRLDFLNNTGKAQVATLRAKQFSSLVNKYLPMYYGMPLNKYYGLNTIRRERKIVVSMTTFPARIDKVWLCVETLLRQSLKPDSIILWLSKEQFKGVILPDKLLEQQKRGLTIKFCEGDLKSHKKYYYSFLEYPNDIVVTVDDDVFYPQGLLAELYRMYKQNSNSICCTRARKIVFNSYHNVCTYNLWRTNPLFFTGPSYALCPIGVGGVLYPPGSVNDEVFNIDAIIETCLRADDLWLKSMSLLCKTAVVKSKKYSGVFFLIEGTQGESLFESNINQNDMQLKAICGRYGLDLYKLVSEAEGRYEDMRTREEFKADNLKLEQELILAKESALWLEGQIQNHKLALENSEKTIEELRSWIAQLENGKEWIAEQYNKYKIECEEKDAIIAEFQAMLKNEEDRV